MTEARTVISKIIASNSTMEKILVWLLIAAAMAIIVIVAIAFVPTLFGADSRSDFGAFGDFVGGMLNPILSFIAIIALIFTIILQQRELSLARVEFTRTASAMERENFEATVFRLASHIRDDVKAIDIKHNGEIASGTDAFKAFYEKLRKQFETESLGTAGDHCKSYDAVYEQYGHDFGHYYRLIYFTFRHIKKSQEVWDAREEEKLGILDVDFYTKLIRAQISDYERLVFFYNFLSGRSENLTPLIEEFALFDNIAESHLLSAEHITLVSDRARGL